MPLRPQCTNGRPQYSGRRPLAYATSYAGGGDMSQRSQFMAFTAAGYVELPPIAGAVAITAWLRVTGPALTPDVIPFLLDGSSNGGPRTYYYRDEFDGPAGGHIEAWFGGVQVFGGFSQLPVGEWRKVYLEVPNMLPFGAVLFNRFSRQDAFAFLQCDWAAIMVQGRAFTAAEKADATGEFPTDAVLARYNGGGSGGILLDSSGNAHHATYQ